MFVCLTGTVPNRNRVAPSTNYYVHGSGSQQNRTRYVVGTLYISRHQSIHSQYQSILWCSLEDVIGSCSSRKYVNSETRTCSDTSGFKVQTVHHYTVHSDDKAAQTNQNEVAQQKVVEENLKPATTGVHVDQPRLDFLLVY